ncbi:THUMP domain-containing protein 2 [Indicator indicator]|uniref:THUMP domain-containing protein 2 n=1 Tax=Indicator indicator TaxID=1002788 RepID=UPI0023E02F70|nr:THUMP domain-containing protein 2 [Indicator indicator]
MAAGPRRFFCTAGRGLEPFLAREVRARLGATEVDCVSGKVFFSTEAGPRELRKLKSGERLFLLLKRLPPLAASGGKGRLLHEMRSLILEEPDSWLDVLSAWRNLGGGKGQRGGACEGAKLPLKRKAAEETKGAAKRLKAEPGRELVSEEGQAEAGEKCVAAERSRGEGCWAGSKSCSGEPPQSSAEQAGGQGQPSFGFRVSCRCSGALAKVLPAQELGRALGTALTKQFGWRAALRDPELEVFVHLNDIHTLVGIPLFRLSLASREYLRRAGLRSTVAWAMASLAEISAGACVLDPMCGLGTILLEAAQEWPDACYWGADISDSQLEGADVNIRTAGLGDKIELIKASVKALPWPSESFDAVISDLPFGKKFKVSKDIQLLPDALQEMERVLRVGGTAVLLLSQELHGSMDGLTRAAAQDSPRAAPGRTSPATTAAARGSHEQSSPLLDGAEEPFLGSCGALLPAGVYGVSLGKTEAFIHKYRKISAAGKPWQPCTLPRGTWDPEQPGRDLLKAC